MSKLEVNNRHSVVILNSSEIESLNITIPKIQRDIRPDRIAEIVTREQQYYKKHGTYNFCFTPIYICRCKKTAESYVVDGMHRLHVVNKFIADGKVFKVLLSIFDVDTIDDVEMMFIHVNESLPVTLFSRDVPKHIVGNNVYKYYTCHDKYKEMFSSAKKANRPNVGLDDFKSSLSDLMDRNECKTEEDVMRIIDNINVKIKGMLSDRSFAKDVTDPMKKKTAVSGFYIGLIKNWPDIYDSQIVIYSARPKIPMSVTNTLWVRDKMTCRICSKIMTNKKESHACHIISYLHGGETVESNLVLGCASCNTSLGSQDMPEYFKTHGRKWI